VEEESCTPLSWGFAASDNHRIKLRSIKYRIMFAPLSWYKNVDLRITKYFSFVHETRIGVIAETFNLFNSVNHTSHYSILLIRQRKYFQFLNFPPDLHSTAVFNLFVRVS